MSDMPPPPSDDDAADNGAVDAVATPREQRRARRFAELVDKSLAGRLPPAMSAEDRELVETVALLRAARVDAVVATAVPATPVAASATLPGVATTLPAPSATAPATATPLWWQRLFARTRMGAGRHMRVAVVAAIAAAAASVLWFSTRQEPSPAPGERTLAAVEPPAHWRSRPADALIGRIDAKASGDAARRVDAIFADRLAGLRERALAVRTARASNRSTAR